MQDKARKYQNEIDQLVPVNKLSSMFQEQLIRQSETIMIPAGNSLFEQSDKSESLFFLLSGDVDLHSEDKFVSTISAGSENARVAINLNFSFSAVTKSRVVLLMIDRLLIERLVILDGNVELVGVSGHADWTDQLLSSEMIAQIPPTNIHKVFNRFVEVIVEKGDQVIAENMPGEYFYLVREGCCVVSRHNHDSGGTITLAELEIGGCFGEESLLSDQDYTTTVTMLTAGRLLRLAREGYDELIKQPALRKVNFDQASSRISKGAIWLDVRFKDEYSQYHLKNSQNYPLAQLEEDMTGLVKEQSYILYCDTGFRSSLAAVLLGVKGFDVSNLDGGLRKYSGEVNMSETWVDGLSDRSKDGKTTTMNLSDNKQSDVVDVSESLGEQVLAVDLRIRDLKSMLATENLIAQEWLDSGKIEQQPTEDSSLMIEARKKIDHIENMPANRLHKNVDDEEDSELSLLRKQLESAQEHLQEERHRVSTDGNDSEQKDLSLRRVSDELETIKNRLKEQESYEIVRRESFEQQLATERKKMSQQLAHFSLGMERHQTKSAEIQQIKRAAVMETRHIIEKFKDAHKQYNLRQQKTIQTVRSQLQQQAAEVIEKAREAQLEKKQALAALREVQKQLDDLKKQGKSFQSDNNESFSELPLLLDVESVSDEVRAKEESNEADAELDSKEESGQLNKDENSVRLNFIDWFTSNEQFNLDRENLSDEQKVSLERVKKIAHLALEDAFKGKHHRPDDSGGHFFKNYK